MISHQEQYELLADGLRDPFEKGALAEELYNSLISRCFVKRAKLAHEKVKIARQQDYVIEELKDKREGSSARYAQAEAKSETLIQTLMQRLEDSITEDILCTLINIRCGLGELSARSNLEDVLTIAPEFENIGQEGWQYVSLLSFPRPPNPAN